MTRLIKIGKKWPFHCLLMPLFFIGHISIRFAGMLNSGERNLALFMILIALTLLFLLVRIFVRNNRKAAIISTVSGILYLFFGDIKYSLAQAGPIRFLSHYTLYIPLTLLFLALFIFFTIRTRSEGKLTLFLNLLFLFYIGLDLASLIAWGKKNDMGIAYPPELTISTHQRADSTKPDIYFIVPDCYPSTGYQREMLGVRNNFLDSVLRANRFYVNDQPASNYSNTAFSMASTLGMNYISGVDTVFQMAPYYYNRSMNSVRHSPVFTLLKDRGYHIINLSIFDLGTSPAFRKDIFLSISTNQIIFYNTAWNCFKRDLLWQLIPSYLEKKKKEKIAGDKKWLGRQKTFNRQLLDTLSRFPMAAEGRQPVFLYAHLGMPHFPYFFNEEGRSYPDEIVFSDSMINDRGRFAAYIGYTNHRLAEFVTRVMEITKGKAVIIIQSDHGLADMDWTKKEDAFRNFSSFYFPDGDYQQLYPGMSNVNSFRVLLNKYFNQSLPLLPDRHYYIK